MLSKSIFNVVIITISFFLPKVDNNHMTNNNKKYISVLLYVRIVIPITKIYAGVIMVTVSHVVQKVIGSHIFLQEAVTRGIISYTLLAKYLQPEIEKEFGKKVKHSSVVMALRRYAEKLEKKQKKPVFNYFAETILKTDICYIVVEESSTSLSKIQNLHYDIDFKKGGIFNIIQGNYEIGIVTNMKYLDKIQDIFSDERILNTVDDLAVISLTYTRDYTFTPGIMYNVLRFLAWENINIVTIICTPQELSLVIKREDTMKCYNTLERMMKSSEKNN